jgi:hypothetical protein
LIFSLGLTNLKIAYPSSEKPSIAKVESCDVAVFGTTVEFLSLTKILTKAIEFGGILQGTNIS